MIRATTLILAALLIAHTAAADTKGERAKALIAQVPSANGAFHGDNAGTIVHLPSGMLCDLDAAFDRHLARLSVQQEPELGEVAACHYDLIQDGNNTGAVVTLSVARATEQNAKDVRDRSRALFLRRHPEWSYRSTILAFKGKVQFGTETYTPQILDFSGRENYRKHTAQTYVGVVRDWIVAVEITGPEKTVSGQSLFLSMYWTDLANRVIAMGELRKRQDVPTAMPPSP